MDSDAQPRSGAPVLVLLPGMDGTGRFLTSFVDALGPAQRTIVVDYPPDEPLGYAELEFIARARLPRDEPFVLLGESFSGPIAVRIAASPPPALRGLVLCCSFLRNPRPWLAPIARVLSLMPYRRPPVWLLDHLLLGAYSTPRLVQLLKEAMASMPPEVIDARLEAILDVDVMPEFSQLELPLLYLRASEDWAVPRAASRLMTMLQPKMRIATIAAPHFLLQTVPETAARKIARFLRDLP